VGKLFLCCPVIASDFTAKRRKALWICVFGSQEILSNLVAVVGLACQVSLAEFSIFTILEKAYRILWWTDSVPVEDVLAKASGLDMRIQVGFDFLVIHCCPRDVATAIFSVFHVVATIGMFHVFIRTLP